MRAVVNCGSPSLPGRKSPVPAAHRPAPFETVLTRLAMNCGGLLRSDACRNSIAGAMPSGGFNSVILATTERYRLKRSHIKDGERRMACWEAAEKVPGVICSNSNGGAKTTLL